VRLYSCVDRGTCAGSAAGRVALGDTSVDGEGAFSIALDRGEIRFFLVLLEAEVDHGATYRSLVADARSDSPALIEIDPISEAAVSLLEDHDLERFDLTAVAAVNDAVRQANESSDFSGQSPKGAAGSAKKTAEADASVQAALDVPPLPPVRSESDGCAVAGTGGLPIEALLIAAVFFWLRRRSRRARDIAA
jgi:hypothetical protein